MSSTLPVLISADKELSVVPTWRARGADDLEFSVPLEVDGVVLEGLTLRGRVRRSLPDREVVFQIEFHGPRIIGGAVCRIEWKPLSAHNNKGIGPKELRHLLQKGSHHHRFDLNWAWSQDAVLKGDMPIAVPLKEEPKNFRALLGVVGEEFRINRIQEVPIPPWEPAML
jgi:hypothetical protein